MIYLEFYDQNVDLYQITKTAYKLITTYSND